MEGRWDRSFFMGFFGPSKDVDSRRYVSGEGKGPVCDAYEHGLELVECFGGDHHGT